MLVLPQKRKTPKYQILRVRIWRRERLVRAETATITLGSNPRRIASTVGAGLGLPGYGDEKITVEDLQPPDQAHYDWCKAVIAEFNGTENLDLNNLAKKAPLIHEQLASDAESDRESIEDHLSEIGLERYLGELLFWCHTELFTLEKKVERYPAVVAMSQTAKDKLSIPWGRLDLLNKYQTALDSQLYKALQDAQEWRLKFVTADVVAISDSTTRAA
jgi:hypothetical protein